MDSTTATPFTANEIELGIAQAKECLTWLPEIRTTESQLLNQQGIPLDRRLGELGPAYLERQAEFKRQRDKKIEELIQKRNELRQSIRERADLLMRLAIWLNCNLQPRQLRDLINLWLEDRHNQPPVAIVNEAQHFLDDLILALKTAPCGRGNQSSPPSASGEHPVPNLSEEEMAIILFQRNPDATMDQIAEGVGCHVKSLPRMKRFQAVRKALNEMRLPKGNKDKDGNLEAWEG